MKMIIDLEYLYQKNSRTLYNMSKILLNNISILLKVINIYFLKNNLK